MFTAFLIPGIQNHILAGLVSVPHVHIQKYKLRKLQLQSMASTTHSPGYGPSGQRNILYFDGNPVSYPIWETRFLNYLYTWDNKLHKAISPKIENCDSDVADKNSMAYAELVQVLDEKSLLLFITDAADDGRIALDILRKHFASTEKSRVLTLYAELKTITMMDHGDVTVYIIRAERANYRATGFR